MSRNSSFEQTRPATIYKDLRHNASEARDYFTNMDPEYLVEKEPIPNRTGRGVNGESSN